MGVVWASWLESRMRHGEGRTEPKNMSNALNTYIHTYTHTVTWSGPKFSVGWGQEVEYHLGYNSVNTEKCLACLSRNEDRL